MTVCKFCQKEIVWVQKSQDHKPKPYNANDLTPHECEESKAAYGKKGDGGSYSSDPRKQQYIIRQSSIAQAKDIVLNSENSRTQPLDIQLEDILTVAEKIESWVMR
jgi:hypothetical protein